MVLKEFSENVDDTTKIKTYSTSIEKYIENKTDVLIAEVPVETEIVATDECVLYNKNNKKIFGGYLLSAEIQNTIRKLKIGGYDSIFLNRIVNEYYDDVSIEDIIKDLIEKYTTLTYVSDFVSGFKLRKIFKDEYLVDVLKKLLFVIDGTYYIDLEKNFSIFVKLDKKNNYIINSDFDFRQGEWNIDFEKKATKVIVKGAKYSQKTTESFMEGNFKEIILSRVPTNLRVTVGGVEQKLKIKDQEEGVYTLIENEKKIIFDTEVSEVFCEYDYQSQIRVDYGVEGIEKEISKEYIIDRKEALEIAKKYLKIYSDGVSTASFLLSKSRKINDFIVGEEILVRDTNITPNINEYYLISSVKRDKDHNIIIMVGEDTNSLFVWQKETQERIKSLEKSGSLDEFLQKYMIVNDSIKISMNDKIKQIKTYSVPEKLLYLTDGDKDMALLTNIEINKSLLENKHYFEFENILYER